MAKNTFDAVVIGNNLEALLIANHLQANHKSFIIIDQNEAPAESIFEDYLHNFVLHPEAAAAFNLETIEDEKEILTYESAKWVTFLGFGNQPPKFLNFITPYLEKVKYRLKTSYSSLLEELSTSLTKNIVFKAKISNFEVVDKKVQSLTINDSRVLKAKSFIFTSSIESLVDWFTPDHIGKKNFQKLAKTNYWTRLELNLKHQEQEVSLDKDYLLSGSTENAVPLFGGFYRNPENFLCSKWVSFLPAELTRDSEEAGNLLREMKRQIKRALPTAFTGLGFEKIKVMPYTDAEMPLTLNDNQSLGNLTNVFVASSIFSEKAGLDGKLLQSQAVLSSIQDLLSVDTDIATNKEP